MRQRPPSAEQNALLWDGWPSGYSTGYSLDALLWDGWHAPASDQALAHPNFHDTNGSGRGVQVLGLRVRGFGRTRSTASWKQAVAFSKKLLALPLSAVRNP